MNFRFTATTQAECKDFYKIKRNKEDSFLFIDEFIKNNSSITEQELESCYVCYRNDIKLYKEYIDDCTEFISTFPVINYQKPTFFENPDVVLNLSFNMATYFVDKMSDCLNTARYFVMKSYEKIDTNTNINWGQGYQSQFYFRCIYFGTAATWYSNTYDHILQMVYWGLKLYTSAKDTKHRKYNSSWSINKTLCICNYDFVTFHLSNRKFDDIKEQIVLCYNEIKKVRKWANYIKHKGGLEYMFLEPSDPYKIYITPCNSGGEKVEVSPFKSPEQIDIDKEYSELEKAHNALVECANYIISAIKDLYSI